MDLPSYSCVLCNGDIEKVFITCFCNVRLGKLVGNLLHLEISDPTDLHNSLESLKVQLNVPFFMDVIILLSWSIWMARNDLIFRNIQPSLQNVKDFFQEFALVILRAKKNAPTLMSSWIDTTL